MSPCTSSVVISATGRPEQGQDPVQVRRVGLARPLSPVDAGGLPVTRNVFECPPGRTRLGFEQPQVGNAHRGELAHDPCPAQPGVTLAMERAAVVRAATSTAEDELHAVARLAPRGLVRLDAGTRHNQPPRVVVGFSCDQASAKIWSKSGRVPCQRPRSGAHSWNARRSITKGHACRFPRGGERLESLAPSSRDRPGAFGAANGEPAGTSSPRYGLRARAASETLARS